MRRPEWRGLSQAQQLALQKLISGGTITAAAKDAKVDRTTVHRWLREDYEFQASLNRARREIQLSSQNLVASLIEPSVQVVRAAIANKNLRAALAVLKSTGVGLRPSLSAGMDDPEHLRKMAELEEKKRLLAEEGIDWNDAVKGNL